MTAPVTGVGGAGPVDALVKCVVWDLDDTLWRGTLAYGDDVEVDPRARALVARLERAGVVQSVASKNDEEHALAALARQGLSDVFVHPQVGWSAKSVGVGTIVDELGIGADTVVLVDDSAFERAEVRAALPDVRCLTLEELLALDASHDLFPPAANEDAARRPAAYRAEAARRRTRDAFRGTPTEFLASLGMRLDVAPATHEDVDRAAELTVRTNQLNTSGRVFSAHEIQQLVDAGEHLVLVARLEDAFGDYGRIGLAIIERSPAHWTIELLLMSCRVGGRNVGTALIAEISAMAAAAGVELRARFVPTARNRQMLLTYRLLGFRTSERDEAGSTLVHQGAEPVSCPEYVQVTRTGTTAALRPEPAI